MSIISGGSSECFLHCTIPLPSKCGIFQIQKNDDMAGNVLRIFLLRPQKKFRWPHLSFLLYIPSGVTVHSSGVGCQDEGQNRANWHVSTSSNSVSLANHRQRKQNPPYWIEGHLQMSHFGFLKQEKPNFMVDIPELITAYSCGHSDKLQLFLLLWESTLDWK